MPPPSARRRRPTSRRASGPLDIFGRIQAISWPIEGHVSSRSHILANRPARAPPRKMPPPSARWCIPTSRRTIGPIDICTRKQAISWPIEGLVSTRTQIFANKSVRASPKKTHPPSSRGRIPSSRRIIGPLDIFGREQAISWPSEGHVSTRAQFFANESAQAPPKKYPPPSARWRMPTSQKAFAPLIFLFGTKPVLRKVAWAVSWHPSSWSG